MSEILIIINNAYDTQHVTEFAYKFASENNKDIIIAQANKPQAEQINRLVVANYNTRLHRQEMDSFNYGEPAFSYKTNGLYRPSVKNINIARCSERELADYIRKQNCSMVISRAGESNINLQTILNQISCPLMLLPENFVSADLNRIVYLTDLRYCQLPIVSTLSKLKGTSLLLAHICQQGLPDLIDSYGAELFKDTAGRYSSCPELFFSHIKEKSISRVVDTLVYTMRADMLVCVNRKFLFQQLFGDYLPQRPAGYITVPVLIFPC